MSHLEVKQSEEDLMKLGVAADHGGFELKKYLLKKLRDAGYEVIDFGDAILKPDDDYPDFVFPLANAVATGKISRVIAVCESGVGACIAASKIAGVRACLIHEKFSAYQGLEDDNMNVICLGGKVVDHVLAGELTAIFLHAKFSNYERHIRRLKELKNLKPALKKKSRLNER